MTNDNPTTTTSGGGLTIVQHKSLPAYADLYKCTPNVEFARQFTRALLLKNPKRAICPYDTGRYLNRFVTEDPATLDLKHKVALLARHKDTVLIYGPSGTGKELLAQALHGDREGAFVPVNCTALPSELLESELFGHNKGAFTGANESRNGKFAAAQDGTLFLDEIGDMPVDMQAKLLRVLQDRKVTPLGSNTEQLVNCRVIAATNKREIFDASTRVFREDLLARLSMFTLEINSITARLCDIIPIIQDINSEAPAEDIYTYLTSSDSDSEIYNKLAVTNVRFLQSLVRRWEMFGSFKP